MLVAKDFEHSKVALKSIDIPSGEHFPNSWKVSDVKKLEFFKIPMAFFSTKV